METLKQLDLTQWVLIQQIVSCAFIAGLFWVTKRPYTASTWVFYSMANIGWLAIASGKA